MYFPSLSTWMLAVFVSFTSVVEFHMITMFMGEMPVAEHDNLKPRSGRNACTVGADDTTLGET